MADIDTSEDVNDFLLRIRELGDQRDKEDEERTRKLEEDILKGRKERQNRREERARSLSPTKGSSPNVGTPSSIHSKNDMSMQEELLRTPSLRPDPLRDSSSDDVSKKTDRIPSTTIVSNSPQSRQDPPRPPSKSQASPSTTPSAALPLRRGGTLSWQQRPSSRGPTGPAARPLSMLAFGNEPPKQPLQSEEIVVASDNTMSRSQITQSLGSRDPSWFKQTHERGSGSAAFRKSQVEDTSDTTSVTNSLKLPGMSRESTVEPESRMSPPPESVRSSDLSQEGSIRGSLERQDRFPSTASITSGSGTQSWLPTKPSQRFEPPSSDTISSSGDGESSFARSVAMSPSQGRISPERVDRPVSPTKGLGGFVQSAMLKRSDSVNKRWSAQAGPGLSRGNSTASNLSGYGGSRYPLGGITPLTESRLNSISRESSPTSNSRPTSSHSNMVTSQKLNENDRPGASTPLAGGIHDAQSNAKLEMPIPRDSKSPDEVMSPPASPSKRWSPTKSSWLENAINKPDSPKVKFPASQQPAWMAEINKAKQKGGSIDKGKESHFKEVAIGGLVRSPPPGTGFKPPNINGLPGVFRANAEIKSENMSAASGVQRSNDPNATAPKDPAQRALANKTTPEESPTDAPKAKPEVPTTTKPTISPKTSKTVSQSEVRPASATNTKSKPVTPPKKDFKSALKPGKNSGEIKTKEIPEFKNVFGNLKRTQTKNYVAPDELKDNIMRGKAGLAQTGGPKKSERKDELKESILQKKQGMVVPSASARITSASSNTQDQPVPEAIAKRQGLTRSESTQSNGASEEERQASKPEALAKVQHLRDKSNSTLSKKPSNSEASPQTDSKLNGNSSGAFTASLAGILQRGPSPLVTKPAPAPSLGGESKAQLSTARSEPDLPSGGPTLNHATKARARGPKRRLPTASNQEISSNEKQTQSEPQIGDLSPQSKSSPSTNSLKHSTFSSSLDKSEPSILPNTINKINKNKPSQPLSPRKPSTTITPSNPKPSSPVIQAETIDSPFKPSPPVKEKPNVGFTSPTPRQLSISRSTAPNDITKTQQSTQDIQSHTPKSVKEKEEREIPQQVLDAPLPSVKGAAAAWGQPPHSTQRSRARSPVKLPTRKDEEVVLEEAGLSSRKRMEPSSEDLSQGSQSAIPQKTLQSSKSPPLPAKKNPSLVNGQKSTVLSSSTPTRAERTPVPRISDVRALFTEIFDEMPRPNSKMNINTQTVLDASSSRDQAPRIKTLRKQIFEITENGKTIPLESQQEHILFDQNLYLCIHVFGDPTGHRTTEAYLWYGEAAVSAAVEDAQLFAKKFAKDNSAKLIIMKQGKETANFFQVLGGIVITRCGSNRKGEATVEPGASYMLCGRQHVGQIAFDEVEYSPRSLCNGFPYIVSSADGKLYLWKGSGSSADELGCARLIGMDLGPTSEIEEIDEGREPAAFWRAFPNKEPRNISKQISSNQHWHLKPSSERYTTRLFNVCFEVQRPKSASGFIQGAISWRRRGSAPANDPDTAKAPQIREMLPFAQSDLAEDGVFVLDAFFEIFVILTLRSLAPAPHQKSTESTAFRAALLFAQEYGILAASAEDRPFVPACSVVLCSRHAVNEEIKDIMPEAMVHAFRKWDDGAIQGCRVVPLNAALEAMGEQR